MTTWEERMAIKAAARRAVTEAEGIVQEHTEEDEAAIAAAVETYAPAPEGLACACVGPQPGCSICYCHIHAEAEARITGKPCGWCARR